MNQINHEEAAEANRQKMRKHFIMGEKPTTYLRTGCSYCHQPSISQLMTRCPPYSVADRETPRQWIDKFFQEVASCYSDDFDKAYLFADFMRKGDDTFHLEEIVREYIRVAHADNSKPSMAQLASIFYGEMWSAQAQRKRFSEFERSYFHPNEGSMQKYVRRWLDVLYDITLLPERGNPIELVMQKLPLAFSNYAIETRGIHPRSKIELGRLMHEFCEYLNVHQWKLDAVLTQEEKERCNNVLVVVE